MKTPIILYNRGDVLVFETVSLAERYAEPIDVLNNEYVAYDSDGNYLSLRVERNDKVAISELETPVNAQSELRGILEDFLAYLGVPSDWLAQAKLSELITEALKYETK